MLPYSGHLHATPYRDRSRNKLPKLTRAHFEALASALREAPPDRADPAEQTLALEVFGRAVGKVAAVLSASNPSFDAVRFMAAVYDHE